MVPLMLDTLTFLHFLGIGVLGLYGIHRIWLLVCWLRLRQAASRDRHSGIRPAMTSHPFVTVQIPLYNEARVAARIIDAAASLDWPLEKLDIQILDDSTDVTRDRVKKQVREWRERGVPIREVLRTGRKGYKAGALAHGLKLAKGDFIAIFDADFVPSPDFLHQVIPWFDTDDIGMVQARWTFLNKGYSWLTRLQAILLAPHFSIEHQVRSHRGLFFNFNGTAGVWRKEAILSSGGWLDRTVTEDLDLSYRAQMAGWRFRYLEDVTVPSELPVTLPDFRIQQERWSKGSIQTARMILPGLLASRLPLRVKIEAMVHLVSNFCWVAALVVILTLYPALIRRPDIGFSQIFRMDLPLFLLSSGAILSYYVIHGAKGAGYRRVSGSIFLLPLMSIGLAPWLCRSVILGLFHRGGRFIRTPKFGLSDPRDIPESFFLSKGGGRTALAVNGLLFVYSILPLAVTWQRETWVAIPFVSLFPLGFLLFIGAEFRTMMIRRNVR